MMVLRQMGDFASGRRKPEVYLARETYHDPTSPPVARLRVFTRGAIIRYDALDGFRVLNL